MPARQHRVTRGDDYRRIIRNGYRVGGALCITHAVLRHPHQTNESGDGEAQSLLPARFGFIVSKAVGGAVTRNLVRRRFKSIAQRHIAAGFSGVDIVFRALPASSGAEFSDLAREIERALDRVERWILAEEPAVSS
ncbi:ribonuclease P protein component [Leucobacter sp. W1153]|uniref:ribonuclease P protein component n=1 Tax=unclassified Leucobacter TaxID=2621730 RepID=UPI003F353969